ncbi:ATP-dependent RNA helicase [Lapidilactobacillus dextrinicus DSM 20335]|uniref:ATP-dependent RNA helicase n=1 Tax=Lapidilactobacillus dextrinicus DSM 20335 TaxID=1423738 RepID=A0A0R2BM84_9LACO|nr:DEAD/DEAH box helicase [Lapidilactobacillus dextrinicus]KRM80005.1 ATP-dependent RNA helicase [Lapidilactobacillus dextrinicus DSM 20335]QFG46222.1 DEAD/DEAH box helicase [Lapidilactobacillus dextrinicus]
MTEIYQEPATPFLPIWQQAGFTKPTPIQQAVYWPLKKGGPVLGLAATGTGKTLAFGLPLLETLQPGQRLQLLILEPSAELVMQVRDVLRPYAQAVGLKIQGIVGKANVKRQQEQLKQHPEIIVATPGRLQEMITNKLVKVDRIETVVIDEADSQLDGEHLNTTRELLATMPADAQMVLMSATEQPIFEELGKWFGYDFERFDTRQADFQQQQIQHDFMMIGNHQKAELLKRLQRGPIDGQNALVFVKNTGSARTLFKTLSFLNLKVGLLLGDETSQRRQKIMQQFRKKQLTYLVTTELAARGLDFPDLKFVVNYDLPQTLVSYTHRAGRTGRMFGTGTVLNLGNEHDHRNLQKTVKTQFQLQTVYLIDGKLSTEKPIKREPLEKRTNTVITHSTNHQTKPTPKKEKPRKKKRLRDQKSKGKHHPKAAK